MIVAILIVLGLVAWGYKIQQDNLERLRREKSELFWELRKYNMKLMDLQREYGLPVEKSPWLDMPFEVSFDNNDSRI